MKVQNPSRSDRDKIQNPKSLPVRPAGKIQMGRGFTLVELIMTVVIAGIVLYALLMVYTNVLLKDVDQEFVAMAAGLARAKLEIVTSKSFGGISSEASASFGGSFADFSSTVEVHCVYAEAPDVSVDPVITSYKRVAVRVIPADVPGARVEMVTLVTDNSQ